MDLGIAGKWALVCAASKGLGKGCASALVREGVNVVITARGADALEATATELRALARERGGGEVRAVAGDITTAEGRLAALAACPQVDILINNAGGPPALLTRMSTCGHAASAAARPAGVVMSPTTCTTWTPGDATAISAAVACSVSAPRAV
ncbi:MAG TPA: SDR family NAD(P)-dependent oxidoreductase, partial [Burkholderiaceae bacterium]|nr:SDR family NAD(P)-dependent oxidoreductase [Burkholderiaceae bacterium]